MNDTVIKTESGIPVINLITYLGNIMFKNEASYSIFNPGRAFLIKNISKDPIEIEIGLVNSHKLHPDYIRTIIYPGWNPEICNFVITSKAAAGSITNLLYGY